MTTPERRSLRVLSVEDSEDDAALVILELRRGGFAPHVLRVDSADAMRHALATEAFDLIVADYSMPHFDGPSALALVQELGLDLPFLLVSGSVSEELAVRAMKAGAHDYLSKGNLARLVPAVDRELREAEVRRERRQAVERLRFLSDAGVALADSLDYAETLARVARLLVPLHADYCAVDAVEEHTGRLERVQSAHRDPSGEALLAELDRRFPRLRDDPRERVARSGHAELLADLTPDALSALATTPEHAELLERLAPRSAIFVALRARGRVLGTITLVLTAASARRYRADDVALAEEVARRAALAVDNARLYREAREAVRARDEFLTIASHELRTPLATLELQIGGLLRRAGSGAQALSEARVAKSLASVRRQGHRLALLINNLLDVSRISRGWLEVEPAEMDLAQLAHEVVARFDEQLVRAGCALSLDAPTPVVGRWDRFRIDQVVTNLVANALKYAPGQPIAMRVTASAGRARLEVSDRGIGIAPEHLERIFGRFERAVSARRSGGLGLGLYIAHEIVRAHGGTITVESRPDEGSTFRVELPLETPPLRGRDGAT